MVRAALILLMVGELVALGVLAIRHRVWITAKDLEEKSPADVWRQATAHLRTWPGLVLVALILVTFVCLMFSRL